MLKSLLWANVSALMVKHYGKENLNRLARECSIGLATAQRIKQQQTSVGVEVLEKLAQRFSLEPWQLLVPGFDPNHMPTLSPISAQERALYERLRAALKDVTN